MDCCSDLWWRSDPVFVDRQPERCPGGTRPWDFKTILIQQDSVNAVDLQAANFRTVLQTATTFGTLHSGKFKVSASRRKGVRRAWPITSCEEAPEITTYVVVEGLYSHSDDRYMHVNLIKTTRYSAGSMSLLPLRCHCRTLCTQQAFKVLSSIMRRLSHSPCMVLPSKTLSYTCPSSKVDPSALFLSAHSLTQSAWASTWHDYSRPL